MGFCTGWPLWLEEIFLSEDGQKTGQFCQLNG